MGKLRSQFVMIASDGLSADAYFDQMPGEGPVEFGYAHKVFLRWPRRFATAGTGRLKWDLIASNVRNVERFLQALE